MTPLLTALSSLTDATRSASSVSLMLPAAAASRKWRTAVRSDDLTALLGCLAFSFCLLRLIWDLMFATRKPRWKCDRFGPPAGGCPGLGAEAGEPAGGQRTKPRKGTRSRPRAQTECARSPAYCQHLRTAAPRGARRGVA